MYNYRAERHRVFTEEGQVMFLKIRDHTSELLKKAGACRASEMLSVVTGDVWEMMACVDRMVELGELREITLPNCWGQFRVFTRPHDHNR